jgi:membrane-associated phospholipid phosphatase
VKSAEILSLASHPSLVTFLGFLGISLKQPHRLLYLVDVSLFYSLSPVLITWGLALAGKIRDSLLSEREDRFLPISIAVLGYLIGSSLLLLVYGLTVPTYLALCYISNTLTVLGVTTRYKVSIHLATLAGVITALVYLFGPLLSPLYCLSIPVGWARVRLGVHDLAQVAWGFVLGATLTGSELFLLHSIL